MATAAKKEEAYPWKASASSGHTTNLKQSILRLSIFMVVALAGNVDIRFRFKIKDLSK